MVVQNTGWQWRALLLSYAVATLLIASYLLPFTYPLWHALDVHTAFVLNNLVRDNHAQQLLWSFGNLRIFDYVPGAAMLLVLVHFALFGEGRVGVRMAQSFIVCVLLIGLVAITRELIFKGVDRDSPSVVLQPFTMLSDTTSLDPKDHSHNSFPGDHATVVATFVYLLWVVAGRRYGIVAFLIAAITVLPRLVSGAHWLSDIVLGGVVTALLTVPWVVFTPVQAWLVERLLRVARIPAGLRSEERSRLDAPRHR